MSKLTRIIRSSEEVTETDANTVFDLLIPIVETDPTADDAIEAARDVISRFPLSDDRLLAHLLDWWYVVTTGQPTANNGAFILPDTFDTRVKHCMDALARLNLHLPAAEWLRKRQDFKAMMKELDENIAIDVDGSVKPGSDIEAANLIKDKLGDTIKQLREGRRASEMEVDWDRELRDSGVEVGSRRYKDIRKHCRKDTENVNRTVALQNEVEPWVRRYVPEAIDAVPNELKHAVGPLAEALLRPILSHNAVPDVDRGKVVERINIAAQKSDSRRRYRLARIVDRWCEETGQTVTSLQQELQRHRTLAVDLSKISAKYDVTEDDRDEVWVHVLEDDIEGAEQALKKLQAKLDRRARAELARNQFEGLSRELRHSILNEDAGWTERLESLRVRLDTVDPYEMAREIGLAQTDLNEQLKKGLDNQLTELTRLLGSFDELVETDSIIRKQVWQRKIVELATRGGRGANELKEDINAELQQLRTECFQNVEKILQKVEETLSDERADFNNEDIGTFENRRSEIEEWLKDINLSEPHGDQRLAEARANAQQLWNDIDVRRIHRWTADQEESKLIAHLLQHCTGALDFDEMDIRRLYVSLKTRPFVILAGLTGSGKSSLTRTFAEALGATGQNRRFRRIAVRPDWIDQTEVLGFVNPISERFVPGWLAETVRDCEREPDHLHFVLLDEMNLAPVEQYLAEWLSAIEEARSGSADVRMPLYSRSMEPKNHDQWPPSLKFPDNLLIIGTVNVDETTRPLSERVLDRANVLLLNVEVSASHHQPNGKTPPPWHVGLSEWRKACTNHPSDKHHEFLIDVTNILRRVSIGVGLRAHLELERFVANAQGIINDEAALDWGIVQRIIPKIRGFKGYLFESLKDLLEEFEGVGAQQSAAILRRWLDDSVTDDEFLEGTDPRLTFARR